MCKYSCCHDGVGKFDLFALALHHGLRFNLSADRQHLDIAQKIFDSSYFTRISAHDSEQLKACDLTDDQRGQLAVRHPQEVYAGGFVL